MTADFSDINNLGSLTEEDLNDLRMTLQQRKDAAVEVLDKVVGELNNRSTARAVEEVPQAVKDAIIQGVSASAGSGGN